MKRTVLALGVLAMSLTLSASQAQTAPAASAVDPASIQALKDMGAYLQTLKRLHVATEVTGERVLADGQKLQHTASARIDVERPSKIRALTQSARSSREIIYDGKTVTLYTPAQKYYSTVEFADTIGGLIFNRLGYLPPSGTQFELPRLAVTIRRTGRKRIEEILLEKTACLAPEQEGDGAITP